MSYKIELLDEAQKVLGVSTDYAVGLRLGIDPKKFYVWRARGRTLPEEDAIQLACLIERHPLYVIARMRMEKAGEGLAFDFWTKVAERYSKPYRAPQKSVSKIIRIFEPEA